MTAQTASSANSASGMLPGANRAAFLLMLAYLMSFVDRQILVLMIEPLQRDLQINDTQFGLLHGTSFALFYTAIGLFVGGWIDRSKNRGRVIAWAVALWSLATALCGVASGYIKLFAARMLVGVGEAALSPGAYSLLSDYFEPRRRSAAFAIYAMGIYLGSGLAFIVGGRLIGYLETIPPVDVPLLGALESWRLTFLIVGLPGLLLALAIRFLIHEPERGLMDTPDGAGVSKAQEAPSLRTFFSFVRSRWRPYACHNIGFGLHMMFSYAVATWLPVVLLRTYGWPVTQVGLVVGMIYIVVGSLGVISGGKVARILRDRGDGSSELSLGAASCLMLLIGIALLVYIPTPAMAIAVASVLIFFVAFPGGLNAASLQIVAPPRFRGQSAALFLLVGNILGLALGPVLVGVFTDYFFGDKSKVDQSLLILGAVTMPIAVALLWSGRKYFRMDPLPVAAEQRGQLL